MKNIGESLDLIRERIRLAEQKYGRKPGSVRLLAVSKTRPVDDILNAREHGQFDFGENYVQEAADKIPAINDPRLIWHFIGPVQSNKTRQIAAWFHWVHSVDRLKIARRLNDARPDQLPPLNICIQVNISNEPTKSGVSPDQLPQLAADCRNLPRLRLRGLMALPEPAAGTEQQRIAFRQVKQLLDSMNTAAQPLDTLSMGTTQDMEAAIAEGATIVRIGTALFGARD
jgi:pyridoxal phosphate enzyme (YggS family)